MSLKCGVCGNWERFSAKSSFKLELTVDCDGSVLSHNLEDLLSEQSVRPETCTDCGSRNLVESDFISDQEWAAQITDALEQRSLNEKSGEVQFSQLARSRKAS